MSFACKVARCILLICFGTCDLVDKIANWKPSQSWQINLPDRFFRKFAKGHTFNFFLAQYCCPEDFEKRKYISHDISYAYIFVYARNTGKRKKDGNSIVAAPGTNGNQA